MHSSARCASARAWAQRDFEVLDRVRCIHTPGLAQLEVGQLYTIKHVLPGGLLVLTEFSRVRAFHPCYFILPGQQDSRRAGMRRLVRGVTECTAASGEPCHLRGHRKANERLSR